MKAKGIKRIIMVVICTFLALVMVFAVLDCFYYPHYKSHQNSISINEAEGTDIRIISANVRTFSPTDILKKSWFYRADLLVQSLAEECPDIIGFQEVTPMHYRYLCQTLSGFEHVIAYRDKSILPEACPIFYRQSKFDLVDEGSFWLSETPQTMSKDWGSKCYRICSYVILQSKADEKKLVVFNTHLDHVSDEARIKGIGVVLQKIEQFGSLPSIIMGDFNADESSETYRAATQNFFDAKYQTENSMRGATFQKFGKETDAPNIDYFMISKSGIQVNAYKILTQTYNGVYTSDHFPIYLDMTLM